jgi:hypothetical protein
VIGKVARVTGKAGLARSKNGVVTKIKDILFGLVAFNAKIRKFLFEQFCVL